MILKYVQISSVVHVSTSKSYCFDRKSFLIIRWVFLGEAQVNGRRLATHGLRLKILAARNSCGKGFGENSETQLFIDFEPHRNHENCSLCVEIAESTGFTD